ncbi:MAG: hypothetical protein IPL83_04260 [Bdellovibrionales bacterium]|nr:hypothetical protein [Bdellovibrionales bacterium]
MVNQAFMPPSERYLLPRRLLSILFLMLLSTSSLAVTETDKDRDHGPQATKACPRYLTFDKFTPLVQLIREYLSPLISTEMDFPQLWQLVRDISNATWGGKIKRGEFNNQEILKRINPGSLYLGRLNNHRIFVQNDSGIGPQMQ